MLSDKVREHLKNQGWWYEEITEEYHNALINLDINLESDFSQFYLHAEDGPTFYSRNREIYQICWFIINSNYMLDVKRMHKSLNLPEEYIPLDSFEGEYGFFYNRKTGEILELSLGQAMKDFSDGKLKPQWKDFNSFIEWFFELTN